MKIDTIVALVIAAVTLVVLYKTIEFIGDCDGETVRGVFWWECIERRDEDTG